MKRVAIALVVGLMAYLLVVDDSPTEPVGSTKNRRPKTPVKLPKQRNASLGVFPLSDRISQSKPEKISPQCASLWNEIKSIDLQLAFKEDPQQAIPNNPQCTDLPLSLTRVHREFTQACKKFQEARNQSQSPAELSQLAHWCRFQMGFYQMELTEWETRDQDIQSIGSKKVLVDKMVARLRGDIPTVIAVAERLLQIDANYYPAAKMALMGNLLQLYKQNSDPKDPAWDALEKCLERAKALRGKEDTQLLEAELGMNLLRSRDLSAVQKKAQSLLYSEERPGMGWYYLAWAAAKQGDRNKARNLLKQAVRFEPNSPQYRSTLEKFDTGSGNNNNYQHSFTPSLAFDFPHLDPEAAK